MTTSAVAEQALPPAAASTASPIQDTHRVEPPPTNDAVPSADVHTPIIEADPGLETIHDDDNDDNDSAIDSASVASSTTSLSESIFEYRRLHGRTYQATQTTEYWAPNDDQQNEGLDIIHNALLMLLDDRLYLAPIDDHPQRVLDVGTGTGIWAIDFADQHPDAEVIGTDISPIQPGWVPANLRFIIDDCLLGWTWPEDHFDFIHLRQLYGSIPDWVDLYRSAYRHLRPGGWVQNLEINAGIHSDHVDYPPDHIFHEWGRVFDEGGRKTGRSFTVAQGHTMRDNMEAAGFVDVVEKKAKLPIHGWPRDPRLQRAGMLIQLALEESIEGFGTFLLTQILGWSQPETVVLNAQMRKEIRNKANYGWCETTIVYGRKPL
ncbi:Putative S-adenosyl-L-methionine-dependent methyltransferase superfamily [Colletotrichum destructivum]|uniref:S-adenosyl-L-methionine-dependent methyltransferase superfamily n=1 Tax=Colletotrichum destructivum TaxID=34406 RepID=A0AAX4J1R2_9PEZI|nr:Putative S-adenosyl-L-methionine-dependent methyltransferase superfamily [Colletotrichum destructivum]